MTGYGTPGPTQAAGRPLPLFDLIGAGLGVLSFIWGFLNFYGAGSSDAKGYEAFANGIGPIGLSILASAIAGAVILSEPVKPVRPPYALATAVAALLVTFGALVGKGDASISIGLILLLITTVAQVAVFAYSWLQATGKIAAKPAPRPSAPQGWGPGQQYGQAPSYGQPPAGYGQPQSPSGQPPQYGQPTTTFGQPAQPGGGTSGGYGPPPGYEPPGYGQAPPPGQAPPANPGQPGGGYGPPPNSGGYGQ